MDDSRDTTDNAQLLVFVRFYDETKKKFCQDLLGLTTLEAHTRREHSRGHQRDVDKKRDTVDLKSVVSINTDGAPSMMGRSSGPVARLKEDHTDLISYQCIIHQSGLCASLGPENAEVMTTMMQLINSLIASLSLQNHMLRGFLAEVNASYDDD